MKLGARVFKTGVAIVFALFIAELLELPSPVFAGIAAIFAIQPSIYRSYQTIVEQVQANIIGATIAVIFGLLFSHHVVAIGIAVIVAIGIMLKFKLEKSLSLSLVTVVAIMEIQGDDFLTFGLIRFVTILVGVLAAFVVNLFFLPPKYEVKLFRKIYFLQDDIIRWTRLAVRQASEHTSTKEALSKFKSRMQRVDTLYDFYKEERNYFKNKKFVKARKLVVYRQMITTSKKSLELLHRLHNHENELAQLPTQFHLMIQERLDFLLTYHEQLLLKYTGKLKPEHSEWSKHIDYVQRNELMEIFIKQITYAHDEGDTEFSSYHLLYILSRILDYEENLEHLDTLIVSYQTHHGHEINVEFEEEFI
ncbi:FUSC family protein [Lysinibacillus xylanilyticus]|uniref:Aromatic acid exporter family protein n=1 Tax=Lysinibacillus xylanilyticus TaxID=582475 RepID=A0ABT4EPU6_9BACI|nr:aromatic acid exporter family protein [Lysinibacillus xylanilyticus]MCY9547038.1 aromatic acid exporter family protein [Lysinibacillus xylanilyticus]MED3801173.1 aromatic acid exporter family protein [Lysinibacillus xylanilyticus]